MNNLSSPISISARTLWAIAGLVVLLALCWLLAVSATGELVLIFGAIVLAEGIRPPVIWLTARRIPHGLAIAVMYFAVIAVLALLAWVITSPLAVQIAQLVDEAPQLTANGRHLVEQYQHLFQANAPVRALLGSLPAQIGSFVMAKASFVLQAPVYIVGLASNTFLLLLISFFWQTASSDLSQFILSLIPEHRRGDMRTMFADMSSKNGGYVRGVLINMLVIGMLSGFGLRLLGVQFTFLLGVVAGLTEAIPIVGPLLGGGAAVVVALMTLGSAKALQVAVLYLAIQQIEGNTLVPLVMNRAVNLHPLTIVISLVIGSALLGIPGAVLSVPAAATIQVLFMHLAVPALRKRAG